MHLLSTRQILQSGLRVEDNKSDSTFCDKSVNPILLATPNLWGNIQIVRTYILKYDVLNSVVKIIDGELYFLFSFHFISFFFSFSFLIFDF